MQEYNIQLSEGFNPENFGFEMAVIGSTRRPTTINNLDVTDLQRIMTP